MPLMDTLVERNCDNAVPRCFGEMARMASEIAMEKLGLASTARGQPHPWRRRPRTRCRVGNLEVMQQESQFWAKERQPCLI